MEKRLPKILDYSDSDFPSLDPKVRSKSTSTSKPRKMAPEYEPVPKVPETGISSRKGERNSSCKVLKPNEHKETFSININEAVKKTSNRTVNTVKPKNVKRDEYLGGNPLDADNPVRYKGKFGVPKKPKRISKTKKNVLKVRKQVSKTKDLAKNVVIEGECVRYDSKLSNEDLRSVLLAKSAEVKKTLKDLNEKVEGTKNDREDQIEEAGSTEEAESTEDLDTNSVGFRYLLEMLRVPAPMLLIHSHSFKMYCDNCLTKALDKAAAALVKQIVRLQLNKYLKFPLKAVANKRYVLGFKQTIKYTRMNRIKLIICVPNMEEGMFEVIEEMKSLASAYSIPYLFALNRRKLGGMTLKSVGVCCFGLLDYSGAEDNFRLVNEEASAARVMYLNEILIATERTRCIFNRALAPGYGLSEEDIDSDTDLAQDFLDELQQLSLTTNNGVRREEKKKVLRVDIDQLGFIR